MSEWIKCSERLPPLSYEESDDENHPYEGNPVLVCSKYSGSIMILVAWLSLDEDGNKKWNQYTDGENGDWEEMEGCKITHWMPLPKLPEDVK